MTKKYLPLLAFALAIQSCSTKVITGNPIAIIKLTGKDNETFSSPKLKKVLAKESPSIVVRTPYAGYTVTQNNINPNGIIYNTLEKELIKAGFTVRDRALFDRVVQQGEMDYSKLKELTNTDLVIEFVGFNERQIKTNRYFTPNGNEKLLSCDQTFLAYSIEFRAIYIKDNEVAGNYTFYYTPCTKGCTFKLDQNCLLLDEETRHTIQPYELMTEDKWSKFAEKSAIQLVSELKPQ